MAERLCLGFQPLHALFRFGKRGARGVEFGARIVMGGLGGDGRGFRLGQRRLRAFDRGGERGMVAALKRRQFALDLGDFAGDAGDALALLARGVLELMALRGEIGERGGEIGENFFGGGEFAIGLGHLGIDAAAPAGAFARLLADGFFLGGELGKRRVRVGGEFLLALAVGGELHESHVEFGDAVLGALLLAVEVLQGDVEPVQSGAGARFGLAQFGQCRGGVAPGAWRLRPRRRRGRRPRATHISLACSASPDLGGRGGPAQMVEGGLRLAHLRRHGAVADRLARLLLQAVDLGGELADHVLDAQ